MIKEVLQLPTDNIEKIKKGGNGSGINIPAISVDGQKVGWKKVIY